MRPKALAPCLLFLLLFPATFSASAQTSKGILAGVARDASGAVIPNASITVLNQATGETRTLPTHSDGTYRIEALAPGRYTVTASHAGFVTSKSSDLSVNASVVTTFDLALAVGGAADVVTVQADTVGVDAENGQLTGVLSSRDIQKLPVFSLNPIDLALTVPGVQLVSQGGALSNYSAIEVNGSRPRSNNFLVDGQEINDVGIGGQAFQPQIPDIFESISVITNAASAEFGRASGGIVNVVTRAGTNDFHGTVFERYSGSGLNALDGVLRQSKVDDNSPAKARYDQHSYGFTAGGPIIKNKLFAFGALELQRFYGEESPNRLELPDAAGYATLQQIGGPQVALLDSYLGNGSYLNSYVAFPSQGVITNINVGVQNSCPNGCNVTTGYFQRQNQAESNTDTQWMYRIDFTPRGQDSFYARYLHDRANTTPDFQNNGSALVGFDTDVGGPAELGSGGWTHVFSANLLNEFRISEARIGATFSPTAQTLANPLYAQPTLDIANIAQDQVGNSSLGPNQTFPQGSHQDLYQLQDTVSLTKGRQTFRIGFDIGRLLETDLNPVNAKGELAFAVGGTGVTALGNFLQNQLGPSGSATKTFGGSRTDPHYWRSGVFAQDDVKLTPDLTVNLGVRYDYLTNPENSLPYPAIDPNNLALPINTVVRVQNDTNNIAPRIGFAYSPHSIGFLGGGKTVLRGGFGIFYDSPFSNYTTNAAASSPNAVSGQLISTTGNGLANATALIPTLTPQLSPLNSVTSVVKGMVNPLTYEYNLGIERQVSSSNLVAVRYVASRGEKLYANQQYNYFNFSTGARLNPARGAINARGNFADSSFNSVQVEYTHNFSRGLQINANYTFGKALDNASEIFALGNSPTSYGSNFLPGGRSQDWGPSAYDHRHFVSVSYSWSPAGFRASNAFANAALGALTRNWTISGIEQFQSGSYSSFTVGGGNSGADTNGDGNPINDRPLLGNKSAAVSTAGIDGSYVSGVVPGDATQTVVNGTPGVYYDLAANNTTNALVPIAAGAVHWLIPNQPSNPTVATEIGRNSFENPGTTRNDIALEKGIGLAYFHLERGRLLFRVEAQDLGNHNDVGILDTNVLDIGSSNYLNTSNARVGGGSNSVNTGIANGRNLVLWAKMQF